MDSGMPQSYVDILNYSASTTKINVPQEALRPSPIQQTFAQGMPQSYVDILNYSAATTKFNVSQEALHPSPVEQTSVTNIFIPPSEKRPMEMLETLSKDLFSFHISNAYTDCVLRVGDTEFPAHRGILSARSEIFAAMFRNDTSENHTGVVDILDVDTDIISDFLNYIYSGKVHGLTTGTAAPLFVVAEKYGLKLLQETCLTFLTDNLTVGNVCDAAVLADTYGEEELEKKVVQFIGDRMADIKGTAQWQTFLLNKHSLAIKLLISVITYKDAKM